MDSNQPARRDDQPHEWVGDLPAQVRLVDLANDLDGDGEPPARANDHRDVDDWQRRTELPLGAETRFGALVEHADRLAGSSIDPVPVMERLAELAAVNGWDERDAIRALDREAGIQRANDDPDDGRGRPGKVEPLADAVLAAIDQSDRPQTDVNAGLSRATREDLAATFADAGLARSTWYRVRRRVLDAGGPDISSINGLSPPTWLAVDALHNGDLSHAHALLDEARAGHRARPARRQRAGSTRNRERLLRVT